MKKLTKAAAVLSAASLVLLAGCGGGDSEKDEGASAKISVAAFQGTTVSLIEQTAVEKGLFKKYGIDADVVKVDSGPALVSALLSDTVQLTGAPTSLAWPASKSGECFEYLTAGQGDMSNIIAGPGVKLPNKDAGYPDALRDIEGHSFGVVARSSGNEIQIQSLLESVGIDPESVEYVATGGASSRIAALDAGQIDFTWSAPPMEQKMEPSSFQKVVQLVGLKDTILADVRQTITAVTCDFAKENPKVVTNICKAMWDSYDYVTDPANKEEVAKFFEGQLNVTAKQAEETWDEQIDSFKGPQVTEEIWKNQAQFLPPKTPVPDYEEHVNECATEDPR